MSRDLVVKIMLTGMERLVCLERDQDISRPDTVLRGKLADNGVREEGRIVRSQGRVGGDDYSFLEAVFNDVLLRTRAGRGLNKVDC